MDVATTVSRFKKKPKPQAKTIVFRLDILIRLSTLLLIAAVLCLSVHVARYALADFYYGRAKTAYNRLDLSQLNYAYELNNLVEDVNRSLRFRRNSADALDFKANLLYQSWWLSPDGQYLQVSQLLQNALLLHEEAQAHRKGWAFSAARMALIYSHQAELDSNFHRWFIESHRLGLYETTIARSLMVVGLQNWEKLSESQQSLTMDFIRASIEQKANSAQAMVILLDGYQLRQEACEALPNTPRKIAVCKDIS
jgi:hypothetical protein